MNDDNWLNEMAGYEPEGERSEEASGDDAFITVEAQAISEDPWEDGNETWDGSDDALEPTLSEDERRTLTDGPLGIGHNGIVQVAAVGTLVGTVVIGAATVGGSLWQRSPMATTDPDSSTDDAKGLTSDPSADESAAIKAVSFRNAERLERPASPSPVDPEPEFSDPNDDDVPSSDATLAQSFTPPMETIAAPRVVAPPTVEPASTWTLPPSPPIPLSPSPALAPTPQPRTTPVPWLDPAPQPSTASLMPLPAPAPPETPPAPLFVSYGHGAVAAESSAGGLTEPAISPVTSMDVAGATATIPTGTQVQAMIEHQIVWGEGMANRFVVRLNDPLTTAGGEVPAQTPLVVEIQDIAESGQVQAQAVAWVHEGQEYPLASDLLLVQGQAGYPLVAQRQGQGHSAGGALADIVLSGVHSATQQATTRITTTVGGTSTMQSGGDLVSGALEGMAGAALNQLGQRQQAVRERQGEQASLWVIPAGTIVTLYVNRPLSLPPWATVASPSVVPLHPSQNPSQRVLGRSFVKARHNAQVLQQPQQAPDPHPPVQTIDLWPDYGRNLSFLETQEQIVNVWLDAPDMLELGFDRPFHKSETRSTPASKETSGHPRLIHLRLNPASSRRSTLLTVLTLNPAGQQRLYQFVLQRGEGSPALEPVVVPKPSSPAVQPSTAPSLLDTMPVEVLPPSPMPVERVSGGASEFVES